MPPMKNPFFIAVKYAHFYNDSAESKLTCVTCKEIGKRFLLFSCKTILFIEDILFRYMFLSISLAPELIATFSFIDLGVTDEFFK